MNKQEAKEELAHIQELCERIDRLQEAEEALLELMDGLDPRALESLSSEIISLVRQSGTITRKREERILTRLTELTGKGVRDGKELRPLTTDESREFQRQLRSELQDLSEHHIFQWSTFYRDTVVTFCEWALELGNDVKNPEPLLKGLRIEFGGHSRQIFTKGYRYSTSELEMPHSIALSKGVSGLQRFLELPIDYYSGRASTTRAGRTGQLLRYVCSSITGGILRGFADTDLGTETGAVLLGRNLGVWAHYLGFITAGDLSSLTPKIKQNGLRSGLEEVVLPAVKGLDHLCSQSEEGRFALPGLGEFSPETRRVTISLLPPPWAIQKGYITLQCYLDQKSVVRSDLEEAANRGVDMIVAPLRPDLHDWATSHDLLRSTVVDTRAEGAEPEAIDDRVRQILEFVVSQEKSEGKTPTALTYNFAEDFPLHNPFLTKYFHVYRDGIRNLLRGMESRNGVRLWCSVRRSGKTTACFDLGSSTGRASVLSQTCDHTQQYEDADVFYREFQTATAERRQLSPDFFDSVVRQAASGAAQEASRFIFVLDEYETLFEHMRTVAANDRELRYKVFQPLLNQMVGFARDNLLIFIGQRPDAHFIFMDQNQLSPYVRQDQFPLFQYERGDDTSEFYDLLRKVLTKRVAYDHSFVEELYEETAGHPYLTVKMLICFFDWLIDQKRPVSELEFSAEDYRGFAREHLRPSQLGVEREYIFFTESIGAALGEKGRVHTPWLHGVYCVLKDIAKSGEGLELSREEFRAAVRRHELTEDLGLRADYLLSSGASANFFTYDKEKVGAAVPLLARLAAVSTRKVG